mmetsp:Transcript_13943/g.20395  ORF Transcript_13943/g.20395 Transcript_13943/m.20395 type:complete len:357 (+) Transcript_13943:29-1099(+)
MGNCYCTKNKRENHWKTPSKLRYSYSSKIMLETCDDTKDCNGILKFKLNSPSLVKTKRVKNPKCELGLSLCVLPGIDPLGRAQKECQDFCFFETKHQNVLIGLYDGHGSAGGKIVEFCSKFSKGYFSLNFNSFQNPQKFIENSTLSCEQNLLKQSAIECKFSGSTQVLCIIKENKLYIGNLGDSRAVLGRKGSPLQMTRDHKPELEAERIRHSGGVVYKLEDGPYRVFTKYGGQPGLAMSRSIGDALATSLGVVSTPEFNNRSLEFPKDSFLVVASDGIWDVMTNTEVVQFVAKYRHSALKEAKKPSSGIVKPKNACISQLLCEEARKRWLSCVKTQKCTIDDISCVIAEFLPLKK